MCLRTCMYAHRCAKRTPFTLFFFVCICALVLLVVLYLNVSRVVAAAHNAQPDELVHRQLHILQYRLERNLHSVRSISVDKSAHVASGSLPFNPF